MDETQYRRFHQGLIDSDKAEFKQWERDTPYFEGCMPIEVMASRGLDTLRFGPMKPVGLTDPNTGKRAHAVVQLRQDNKQGSLWNMVGFQTKMKHNAQIELLRQIPGLESAEFARLGGLHRNTFIRSPVLLDRNLRLKSSPNVRFAGQITGCEGYVESAAVGLLAGIMAAGELSGREISPPPATTALGALLAHITGDADPDSYQPMNVNFGLFAPMDGKVHKKERKLALTNRGRTDLAAWMRDQNIAL
jgi:methylenetetrahydrofolate--tRNA-(uracil-5-)-methyltransferase